MQFSDRVMEKWFQLDEALKADHSFSAVGIVGFGENSDVAIFFSPGLDKNDVAEITAAIATQQGNSVD